MQMEKWRGNRGKLVFEDIWKSPVSLNICLKKSFYDVIPRRYLISTQRNV